MDTTIEGFFLNYYQRVRNQLKSEQIKNFTNLDTNEEKFHFVHNLNAIQEKLRLKRYDGKITQLENKQDFQLFKDLTSALELKRIGNKFFQNEQWPEALNFYNKSYLMTPGSCGKYQQLRGLN